METVITGLIDFYPRLRKRKPWVVVVVCCSGLLLGIPFTCRVSVTRKKTSRPSTLIEEVFEQGGGYLIDLLDYYAAGWPYLFIALVELLVIGHVYGVEAFLDDLRHLVPGFAPGNRVRVHLAFLYMTLAPGTVATILILSWASYEPLTRDNYTYSAAANALGWVVAAAAILPAPAVAAFLVARGVLYDYRDLSFAKVIQPLNKNNRCQSKMKKKTHVFKRVRLTFRKLTHHTPMWRENAERAMVADKKTETRTNTPTSSSTAGSQRSFA